jgi:hypothetical protein
MQNKYVQTAGIWVYLFCRLFSEYSFIAMFLRVSFNLVVNRQSRMVSPHKIFSIELDASKTC